MPWKNGQGWTTELFVAPHGAAASDGAFDWRLSIADIEAENCFSAFPGYDRALLVLDGTGILLEISDREDVVLHRGQSVNFAGEAAVHCRLLGGPTRDFNVMTRRDALEATLLFRPLVGTSVIIAEPGVFWAVHLVAGHASVKIDGALREVAPGDSLIIESGSAARGDRLILDGAGEAVMVRFRHLTSGASTSG